MRWTGLPLIWTFQVVTSFEVPVPVMLYLIFHQPLCWRGVAGRDDDVDGQPAAVERAGGRADIGLDRRSPLPLSESQFWAPEFVVPLAAVQVKAVGVQPPRRRDLDLEVGRERVRVTRVPQLDLHRLAGVDGIDLGQVELRVGRAAGRRQRGEHLHRADAVDPRRAAARRWRRGRTCSRRSCCAAGRRSTGRSRSYGAGRRCRWRRRSARCRAGTSGRGSRGRRRTVAFARVLALGATAATHRRVRRGDLLEQSTRTWRSGCRR